MTTMYETASGVEQYATMAEGYDGRIHVERLRGLLKSGAAVLELGMGPGVDLDMLAQTFAVVGSDRSQAFLDRYARLKPEAELLLLDAVTIDTDRHFDAIYSNKVLHHLAPEELQQSLARQAEIVGPGGLLIHGIWAGTTSESYDGLLDQRYTPDTLGALIPQSLDLIECVFYQEMAVDDSLQVLLRTEAGSSDT